MLGQVTEFKNQRIQDSTFENVDLSGSRFHNVDLSGVEIKGAVLFDVVIEADIKNIRINDVDVVPLVVAELDRRYPERVKLRPTDADGFREAWSLIEELWAPTVDKARRLPPELLHERVDDEWSFIETLRHLVFATDAWIKRAVLGDPTPYDALDLPHDEMSDEPNVPRNRDARPSLDEVLTLRADRMATVRNLVDEATDEFWRGMTKPVPPPGYPASESFPVGECMRNILDEEWAHRRYAERDLATLSSRL